MHCWRQEFAPLFISSKRRKTISLPSLLQEQSGQERNLYFLSLTKSTSVSRRESVKEGKLPNRKREQIIKKDLSVVKIKNGKHILFIDALEFGYKGIKVTVQFQIVDHWFTPIHFLVQLSDGTTFNVLKAEFIYNTFKPENLPISRGKNMVIRLMIKFL
jgi:hypothetical protein